MPDRPIILPDWQVRAALAKPPRLSLVVVPLKVQSPEGQVATNWFTAERPSWYWHWHDRPSAYDAIGVIKVPFAPGDRLWCKEAAWICPPRWTDTPVNPMGPKRQEVAYKADDLRGGTAEAAADYKLKLTPSIHLPRWASRLWLAVESVEVRRVGEINRDEAEAAGCKTRWTCISPGLGSYAIAEDALHEFADAWSARYLHLPFETTWAAFGCVTVHRGNIDAA